MKYLFADSEVKSFIMLENETHFTAFADLIPYFHRSQKTGILQQHNITSNLPVVLLNKQNAF